MSRRTEREPDGLIARVRDRGRDQNAIRYACVRFFDRDPGKMGEAIGRGRATVHHWITGREGVDELDLKLVANVVGVTVESLRYPESLVLNGVEYTVTDPEYWVASSAVDGFLRGKEHK